MQIMPQMFFISSLDYFKTLFSDFVAPSQPRCYRTTHLCFRFAGFIPPPLIFGAAIDSTCLFWSSDCGDRGACVLYNNMSYRHLYVSLAIILKGVAFLLYTTTWYCLRRNYKKYIKGHEASQAEFYPSLTEGPKLVDRTKFIYNLEDHEFCENMESVL